MNNNEYLDTEIEAMLSGKRGLEEKAREFTKNATGEELPKRKQVNLIDEWFQALGISFINSNDNE